MLVFSQTGLFTKGKTAGRGNTDTVARAVDVQGPKVELRLYTPWADKGTFVRLASCCVLKKPLGPCQEKTDPDEAAKVSVVPLHTPAGAMMLKLGAATTVVMATAELVQPFELVTSKV